MGKIEWLEGNRIKVVPPKKCKKITGTRFAAIMGLNPYASPFKTWCAITRTYEEPFIDTIYTAAGKVIEPKQADYIREKFFWNTLKAPADYWGENFFKETRGDFFPTSKILGGMWDYLFVGKSDRPKAVLEMKTTKRVEDWKNDIPEYYALQAALYAYLLDVDDVYMVCTFLEDKDYRATEAFVCSDTNTVTHHFKVSERYPDMEKKISYAEAWWEDHVVSGISPPYDEKKDADVLRELRKNTVNPNTDVGALIAEAEELKAKLDAHAAEVKDLSDRYKAVTGMIKDYAVEQFRDGDTQVSLPGGAYVWTVGKSTTAKPDLSKMKMDGVYDKYVSYNDSYRLTMKKKGED